MLQVKYVKTRNIVIAYITTIAAHTLVTARAECLFIFTLAVVSTSQDNNADFCIVASNCECINKLNYGFRAKCVAHFWAINRDFCNTIIGFVNYIFIITIQYFPIKFAHGLNLSYVKNLIPLVQTSAVFLYVHYAPPLRR